MSHPGNRISSEAKDPSTVWPEPGPGMFSALGIVCPKSPSRSAVGVHLVKTQRPGHCEVCSRRKPIELKDIRGLFSFSYFTGVWGGGGLVFNTF